MKKRKKKKQYSLGGLQIASEALHLLRTAPLDILACYYIGALPFLLLALFFCADMSRGASAHINCVPLSFLLALLFVWMKSWQTIFLSRLMAHVAGSKEPRWTLQRTFRMVLMQAVVQPLGLILIPLSMLVMLPFAPVYAYFQNVSVFGNGTQPALRDVHARASKIAMLWQKQSHVLLWIVNPWGLALGILSVFGSFWLINSAYPFVGYIQGAGIFFPLLLILIQVLSLCLMILAPFGCVVFINVAMILILAPTLLHMLLGVDTVFTLSGAYALLNTTFLITVFGISCMVVDPISKAAHLLRCFYGESLSNGEDLLTALREAKS